MGREVRDKEIDRAGEAQGGEAGSQVTIGPRAGRRAGSHLGMAGRRKGAGWRIHAQIASLGRASRVSKIKALAVHEHLQGEDPIQEIQL